MPTIELTGDDVALIIREDGHLEMTIKEYEDDVEAPYAATIIMAVGSLLAAHDERLMALINETIEEG